MGDEKTPAGTILWVNVRSADAPEWRIFGITADDEESDKA